MALACLPEELIEPIACQLNLQSFRAFRLVCVALEQRSRHKFTSLFFQKRTIIWREESFRNLLDVTSSPLFGHALQDLVIDATPRYAIRSCEITKQLADDQNGPEAKERYLIEKDAMHARSEESARFWNETRYDRKSLRTVFERLGGLRSIVFVYDGMDKVYAKFGRLGRQYCESSQHEMSRPFVATMDAVAASGIKVGSISMDDRRHHGAVSIGRLESLAPSLSKFEAAFEQLQVLKLSLRDWRYPELGFEPPTDRPSFAVRFLSKCTAVRELTVSCFSSLEVDIFVQMAKHCQFRNLKSCTLELFRFSEADLLLFLSSSKHSLRSLSLSHVVLRDDTKEWADIMRYLANNLTLERVELKNLFDRVGARIGIDGTFKGALSLDGVHAEVSDQLRYHAEHLVAGNWGPAWYLASVAYPFVGLRT